MEQRSIIVDMRVGYGASALHLRQGDKGIPLEFSVFDSGKGVDLGEWDTCTLEIEEDGEPLASVPCEIGNGVVTCKVTDEMTANVGELNGRLVFENKESRLSSEDIAITVMGTRKTQAETAIKTATPTEYGMFENARRAYENAKDATDLLQNQMNEAKKAYDAARKTLQDAVRTYENATRAREDGMKILSRASTDMESAKDMLRNKTIESSTAVLLLQKATSDKEYAQKAYEKGLDEVKKCLDEIKNQPTQEVIKESPEMALRAMDTASSARKAVESMSTELDNLKATVASLVLMRKED